SGERLEILPRVDGAVTLDDRAGRWRVLLGETSEPELVEDLERALARAAAEAHGVRIERHRHVDTDSRQRLTLPRIVCVPEKSLAIPLVLDLRRVREEVLHRAVGRNQLARAFVAD